MVNLKNGVHGPAQDGDMSGATPNRPGLVVWFTGLSGAGKTTIARALYAELSVDQRKVELLDGDELRKSLCRGLGFTKEDRDENVHRIAYVASLLAKHGVVVLVAAIAPYRAIRDELRARTPAFLEIYVNAPLSVCERRDVKGHYRRARQGELKNFTGVADPYEPPLNPDVECRTEFETVEESTAKTRLAIQTFLAADVLP